MKTPESPRSFNEELDHQPLRLSLAVREATSTYMRESNGYAEPGIPKELARIAKTLRHYAPETLSQRAMDAAMLQPLADQIQQPNHPVRNHAAGLGLSDYFTYQRDDRNSRSNGFVGTILGGLPHIDVASDVYRQRLDAERLDVLDGSAQISKEDWLNLRVGANIPELARVGRSTNPEAQLARAALMIDRVVHADDDDQQRLKNILRVETFYSPLLEVYGLHAFDMMAQSVAGAARVIGSGNEAVLEQAATTLDQAKQISAEQVMQNYFGNHPSEHLFQAAEEALYGEKIIFSSTSLEELTDGHQTGELNARFKSVGKYALKLLRNPHYALEGDARPADVFGMLAVLPDPVQLGVFFASTIERVQKSPSIDLAVSASKTHPIYIQGSADFVRKIAEQLPSDILHRYVQTKVIDDVPEAHMYQVAKFTSNLSVDGQNLPVELQFQTKTDRANARLGVPSHMNHNAGNGIASIIPGTSKDLRAIFMRKHDIDPNGERVNVSTISDGEEFLTRYKQALTRG